jgi:sugar phosphate isomerase/epimerase
MRRVALLAVVLCLMVSCSTTSSDKREDRSVSSKDPAEKLHWRLGMQAWTFRKLSLYEAIDQINRLGVRYVEMYPGQKLSPDSNVKADHNMPAEQLDQLIARLKSANVTPVSYGVVDVGDNEASARKVFDFAKKLGLEQIVSEPKPEMIVVLDNLTAEYGIKLAIHDHPKPSRYWNPDAVLQVLPGRSDRIGACADVGHWYRSGLVPVECLKRLQGRIIELHMKDVNEAKDDVVWGTGKVDVRGVMEEIKRQGVRNPLFAIEYEKGEGEELIANVSKSIEYFKSVAAELAAK